MTTESLIEQYENAAIIYPMYARYYHRRIDEMLQTLRKKAPTL